MIFLNSFFFYFFLSYFLLFIFFCLLFKLVILNSLNRNDWNGATLLRFLNLRLHNFYWRIAILLNFNISFDGNFYGPWLYNYCKFSSGTWSPNLLPLSKKLFFYYHIYSKNFSFWHKQLEFLLLGWGELREKLVFCN